MEKTYFSHSKKETQELGKLMAKEAIFQLGKNNRKAVVLALAGDLGSGKTTFSQGFLSYMKTTGPYTSPTFVVMKKYLTPMLPNGAVYHIDAYRINEEDLLGLGWEEILAGENIVLLEWPEKIQGALSPDTPLVRFELLGEKERRIIFE